jgi:hypothetical protein
VLLWINVHVHLHGSCCLVGPTPCVLGVQAWMPTATTRIAAMLTLTIIRLAEKGLCDSQETLQSAFSMSHGMTKFDWVQLLCVQASCATFHFVEVPYTS